MTDLGKWVVITALFVASGIALEIANDRVGRYRAEVAKREERLLEENASLRRELVKANARINTLHDLLYGEAP